MVKLLFLLVVRRECRVQRAAKKRPTVGGRDGRRLLGRYIIEYTTVVNRKRGPKEPLRDVC
jgi:hypothetical protein